MPWNERADCGADDCSCASHQRAAFSAGDADADLGVVATERARADRESSTESDGRADGGSFSAAAGMVSLDFEDLLFTGSHGAGGHLLRRPAFEWAVDRAGFQGQANPVAGVQLSKGLPVVPILRRRHDSEQTDYEDQFHMDTCFESADRCKLNFTGLAPTCEAGAHHHES